MYRYTYVVRVSRVTATVFSGHVKLFSSIQSSIPLQLDHGLLQQTSSNFCSISCYMSSFLVNCYIDTENPRDVFPKCPVFVATTGEAPCDTAQLLGASEDWVAFRYFEDEVLRNSPKSLVKEQHGRFWSPYDLNFMVVLHMFFRLIADVITDLCYFLSRERI